MEIHILAFGQLADLAGKTAWSLQLGSIKNTDDLVKTLAEKFPALSAVNYSIAVNKHIVHNNTILKQDDTVALLPPYSGG